VRRITIDCETTGFDPKCAGIVEVGAVCFENGMEVAQFSEICRPHESCLVGPKVDEALKFSGITRGEILAARPSSEVSTAFVVWLGAYIGEDKLHAYNVEFEARFLGLEPWLIGTGAWGECIMLAASQVIGEAGGLPLFKGGKYKYAKLVDAAAFFGVMRCGEHRALTDARTAALVYEEILKRRKK
jgi:DNA polymerase III epsilon subunit-like protein